LKLGASSASYLVLKLGKPLRNQQSYANYLQLHPLSQKAGVRHAAVLAEDAVVAVAAAVGVVAIDHLM